MQKTKKQEIDRTQEQLEDLQHLLSNKQLLLWVAKYGANLEKRIPVSEVKGSKESLVLMDDRIVKAFITGGKFKGTTHSCYSLGEFISLAKIFGEDSKVLISNKKDYPCFVQSEQGVVIIAPRVEQEEETETEDMEALESEEAPVQTTEV